MMDVNKMKAFRIEGRTPELRCDTADHQLLYVISGKVKIALAEQNYYAVSGQVVLTASPDRAISVCPGDDFCGYLLQIDAPIVAGLIRRYLPYVKDTDSQVIVLTAERQDQSIRILFENIVEELHNDAGSAATIIELRLQELFVRLNRTAPKVYTGDYSNREDIVSEVQELLEKKYDTDLSLKSIAAQYNISVSYLAHIFKEITGTSVMRQLLLIRVREAKRYLAQTTLPIKEITEKCGFNDVSNFGRTFRKETGFAPRQYRRAHPISDKKETEKDP